MAGIAEIGFRVFSRQLGVIREPGDQYRAKIGEYRDKEPLAISFGVIPGVVQPGIHPEACFSAEKLNTVIACIDNRNPARGMYGHIMWFVKLTLPRSEFAKCDAKTFIITDLDAMVTAVCYPDAVEVIHIYTNRRVKLTDCCSLRAKSCAVFSKVTNLNTVVAGVRNNNPVLSINGDAPGVTDLTRSRARPH